MVRAASPEEKKMASVTVESELTCPAERAWALLADFENPHKAFAGVLTGARAEDGGRVVTFANGMEVREIIVDLDDARRRVAYAAVGGRFSQHAAAMQVVEDGGGCRFLWTSDFLPDDAAPLVKGLMQQGAAAFARVAEERP
jgi:carbon monoxide dehydrogenase subunit G